MSETTTLILGGGFGGIVTANTLRTLLPKEHKIVLVDKRNSFHVGATKTWVMLGMRTPQEVTRSLDALKRRGVEVVQASVKNIDPAKREVVTESDTLRGDYLVIALGADLNMGAIEGLEQAAQTFYTMDAAMRLRDTLKQFSGGDIVLLNPRMPIKCPPAPYEAAMLLHHAFKMRGLLNKTRFNVYTVEPAPMPTAGPEMGKFISGLLSERNIALHTQKRVRSADAARHTLTFEDGSEARYDLLIAIPPHEAPRAAKESGLTNQSGWIPADPKTLKTAADRVYAIGDVSVVPLPGRYKPDAPLVLPKAGVFAEAHGKVVAGQIAAHVLGKEPSEVFDGKGFCFIETGDSHAVRGDGNFYATPHPFITPRSPDLMQFQEKEAWVEKFMKTNLA
jgi:sulfide:quinone oxidoreductase